MCKAGKTARREENGKPSRNLTVFSPSRPRLSVNTSKKILSYNTQNDLMRKPLCLYLLLSLSFQLHSQKPLAGRDSTIRGPQSFAMVIGISKYKFIRPLNYADKDADLFADYLRSPAGGSLKESNLLELTNEAATAGNFWSKGFQWLKAKQLQKGDKLFIYLAGHGDAIDEDQFFFLGYDCNPGSDKDNYLISGAIQLYNLKKKIADQTAKGVEVYFIMDACRSNELPGGSAGQSFLNTAVSQKRAGEMMMLATEAGQESLEDASIGNGHGLFTYYLVDGLSGLADGNSDGRINFSEIKSYVDKNVPPIAQQRFKRVQVPFFCCDENGNKIIANVDASYLKEWLRIKKSYGGNSFEEDERKVTHAAVDTQLVETYNKFNRAIKNGSLEGANSAGSYYEQLNKKYPNDPYTLDAQSTLAGAYVNNALARINDYIGCVTISGKDKARWMATADRLGKAIQLLNDYNPDLGNSLLPRYYLLRSLGAEDSRTAFEFAFQARSIEPNAAYINNCLARLHLAAGNADSARYYADKAVKRAPNWACALTTLALVQQMADNKKTEEPKKYNNAKITRPSFGFTFGGGVSNSNPTFEPRGNTTILGASAASSGILDLGLIYFVPIGKTISIRPSISFEYGNMNIYFEERNPTGGIFRSRVDIKNSTLDLSLPIIFHFKGKKPVPYLALGPSFKYNLGSTDPLLPVKRSLFLADAAFGLDFPISKSGMVLSPELKYAAGLSDMREPNANTNYSNALGSLKRSEFTLGIYLRKK